VEELVSLKNITTGLKEPSEVVNTAFSHVPNYDE